MNFTINLQDFDLKNVYYLEPQKNVIMDGWFTRLNFASPYFTMNSLFFVIPITIKQMSGDTIKFDPNLPNNLVHFKKLVNIESQLLNMYSKLKLCNFKHNLLLAKQVYNGYIKVHIDDNIHIHDNNEKTIVVKISGVWHSNNEIGIAYKLFLSEAINY